MTKGERRKQRKQARALGLPLAGELALGRGDTQAHSPIRPPTGTSEVLVAMMSDIQARPLPDTRTFLYYQERVITPGAIEAATKIVLEQHRKSFQELADRDRGESPCEFSETPKGRKALDKWAERYEEHNGAPDSSEDV